MAVGIAPPGDPGGTVESLRNWGLQVNALLRALLAGKSNMTGECTLTPSATSTVVQDARIGEGSMIFFMPQTASARGLAPPQVTAQKPGEMTIGHASNAATDLVFGYVVLG